MSRTLTYGHDDKGELTGESWDPYTVGSVVTIDESTGVRSTEGQPEFPAAGMSNPYTRNYLYDNSGNILDISASPPLNPQTGEGSMATTA